MSQATEQIARQFANGGVNRVVWGDLIYNVKVYGVKGDGVTDDTAAINSLINKTTKGRIVFPPGEYLLSRQGTRLLTYSNTQRGYGILLLNKSDIALEFMPGAVIKMPVDDASVFNGIWVEGCDNVKFVNPQFEGIGTTTTTILEEGSGINITTSSRITVDGAVSTNMRGCTKAFRSNNVLIHNGFSSIYANEHSSAHFALYSSLNSTIDHCTSYGATRDGDIFIFGGDSINCMISNCRSHSYVYNDSAKTIFFDIAQGIMIDSSGRNCKIMDCYAYGYYYAFDIKNASEGCSIEGCTAEKSKFSFSSRKGEGASTAVNVVSMIGNKAIPNGGNGNPNPFMGITIPIAYAVTECYGGGIVSDNMVYNSFETKTQLDYIGMVVSLSDDAGDNVQGGLTISGNTFTLENRLISLFGWSRTQAIIISPSFTAIGITITDNDFDLPQDGMTTNLIEATNVKGLTISGNRFGTLNTVGKPLIKLTGCSLVNISTNTAGFHFGVLEAYNCQGISFLGNVTGDSINTVATPTVFCNNCQWINVNGNTQYPISGANRDSFYYQDVSGSNWVNMQNNLLHLINKTPTTYYSSVATNFSFTNNVVG